MPLTAIDRELEGLRNRETYLKKIKLNYNGAIENTRQFIALNHDSPEIIEQFWSELDSIRSGDAPLSELAEPEIEAVAPPEELHSDDTSQINPTLLMGMTVDRLRALADRLKIKTLKTMTKPQLVEKILLVPKPQIKKYIAKV